MKKVVDMCKARMLCQDREKWHSVALLTPPMGQGLELLCMYVK